MQGDLGELTIATPRDRDGTFEPQLIGKYQRRVPGFDEKILALYAKGMTTRDIQQIVQELYGVEVSAMLISEITADLDAEVTAWRTRQLAPVWPIVFLGIPDFKWVSWGLCPQTPRILVGMARAFKGGRRRLPWRDAPGQRHVFDAPFGPVIPCRDASPQSTTPFHRATLTIGA